MKLMFSWQQILDHSIHTVSDLRELNAISSAVASSIASESTSEDKMDTIDPPPRGFAVPVAKSIS